MGESFFDHSMKSIKKKAKDNFYKLKDNPIYKIFEYDREKIDPGRIFQHTEDITNILGSMTVLVKGFEDVKKEWDDASLSMGRMREMLERLPKKKRNTSQIIWDTAEFSRENNSELNETLKAAYFLETQGLDSKKWLPLIHKMSKAKGVNMRNTALTVGRSGKGEIEAIMELENVYGISYDDILKYNPDIRKDGTGMVKFGGKSRKKLRNAIMSAINDEYPDAATAKEQAASSHPLDSVTTPENENERLGSLNKSRKRAISRTEPDGFLAGSGEVGAGALSQFSSSVDKFSRAAEMFAGLFAGGKNKNISDDLISINPVQAAQPQITIINNITVNGNEVTTGESGVTARDAGDTLQLGIPKSLWQAFNGRVKPLGQED